MSVEQSPIGYYVHHHGAGHATRAQRIAEHLDGRTVLLSELDLPGGVRLPSDVVGDPVDPTASGALHWAPLGEERHADRVRVIVEWITRRRPTGMVIDVSCEAALLCRLAGVATVVIRQHGVRDDPAHTMAYRSAATLVAPFPPELEHPDTPPWVTAKTTYAGFITPTRSPSDPALDATERPSHDDVVVLWGSGGGHLETQVIDALRRAHPTGTLWLLGAMSVTTLPPRTIATGRVPSPIRYLADHPVVVASAGNNTVADAARARCPLVVCPQDRPFDEQHRHAESLDAAEVAAVVADLTDAAAWREAIDVARTRRTRLAEFGSGDGARRAAHAITTTFDAAPPA